MDLGKELTELTDWFYEDGRAQWRHLPSVPMHREKKNRKKKGRKRMVKWRCQKRRGTSSSRPSMTRKGVTSKKLEANFNVDRFCVDRIVREAAAMTYRRAIGPQFSLELEQRQKEGISKENGPKHPFWAPPAKRWTLLQSHNFVLSWIFGVSSSRRLKRETWTPK